MITEKKFVEMVTEKKSVEMITDKKFIDGYDFKYVLTSTSTDTNKINVEIHRFHNDTIKFDIPGDKYDELDFIVKEKLIMDFRNKKINKIINKLKCKKATYFWNRW